MKRLGRLWAAAMIYFMLLPALPVGAQDLSVVTVDRPPFSFEQDGIRTGFSIELWEAVARDLGRGSSFTVENSFSDMLGAVREGTVDAAVANISITAEREQVLDFSHSIFQSGLQIMVPAGASSTDFGVIFSALMSRDILLSIGMAVLLLFSGGMLMWVFERKSQPYFEREAPEAIFPSFWWALNLVVNGGFEERVPRTFFGRIFAVMLVVSSLFIVSIFVAKITAVLTVDALAGSVNSVNDLYGKQIATISGSTSAAFLEERDIDFSGYPDLDSLLIGFEAGEVDAVVFDAPILAYYANTAGREKAQMIGSPFRRESYGFALPSQSPILEQINQTLLKLREDGTYDRLYRKYFGAQD